MSQKFVEILNNEWKPNPQALAREEKIKNEIQKIWNAKKEKLLELTKQGYRSHTFRFKFSDKDLKIYIDLVKEDGIEVEIINEKRIPVTNVHSGRTSELVCGEMRVIWKH